VQLGYISRQLGHADVAVTAQHYARWGAGSDYRDPMARRPGEVPADSFASWSKGGHTKAQRSRSDSENAS